MREKLQILMNSENLTGSKLAEYLGIQPSSISHILGGRNKPSLDFVQKILQRYPRINPDWLLLDSDEMYRPDPALAETPAMNAQLPFDAPNADTEVTAPSSSVATQPVQPTNPTIANDETNMFLGAMATSKRGNVKRVIVLFDDNTFESYQPRR